MTQRNTLLIGTVCLGLAVALGAFGAHGLKAMLLANNRVDTFETAVRYQFYHGFALLIVGLLMFHIRENASLKRAALCWLVGILLFSGSLYVLCFTPATAIALLTPIGGVFFLAGWTFLALGLRPA